MIAAFDDLGRHEGYRLDDPDIRVAAKRDFGFDDEQRSAVFDPPDQGFDGMRMLVEDSGIRIETQAF